MEISERYVSVEVLSLYDSEVTHLPEGSVKSSLVLTLSFLTPEKEGKAKWTVYGLPNAF